LPPTYVENCAQAAASRDTISQSKTASAAAIPAASLDRTANRNDRAVRGSGLARGRRAAPRRGRDVIAAYFAFRFLFFSAGRSVASLAASSCVQASAKGLHDVPHRRHPGGELVAPPRTAVDVLFSINSSTRVWAELHERAFSRLGGVPRVIVLDRVPTASVFGPYSDPDVALCLVLLPYLIDLPVDDCEDLLGPYQEVWKCTGCVPGLRRNTNEFPQSYACPAAWPAILRRSSRSFNGTTKAAMLGFGVLL
jgi:hypothetical protein